MSAMADAPALVLEQVSDLQRAGKACCWCRAWPDRARPVPLLHDADVRLLACLVCADLYEVVPVVEAGR